MLLREPVLFHMVLSENENAEFYSLAVLNSSLKK